MGFAPPRPTVVFPALGSANYSASNTSYIQTALNNRGRVEVRGQGVAFIDATLVIHSDTDLYLEPGLTIKQAPGTNSSLLRTAASLATGVSITTTWTSGTLCTVTWPNHGLSIGNWVWLQNASGADAPAGQQQFLGVFPIVSVTDANDFVIQLRRVPTANASFALTAVVANTNVTVGGFGLWDFDQLNNSGATYVNTQAIVFVGVAIGKVDVRVQNALKYCLTVSAVAGVEYGLVIPATTNSDGIKIYGPAFDCKLLRLVGYAGDDFLSFQPKEAAGFLAYPLSEGEIVGMTGGGITHVGTSNTSIGTVTFYAHSKYIIDEVDLYDVDGKNPFRLVNIRNSGDQTTTQTYMGEISVRGIKGTANYPVYCDMSTTSDVGSMLIDRLILGLENSKFDGVTGTNGNSEHIYIAPGVTINELVIGVRFDDPTFGTSALAYFTAVQGNVAKVTIPDPFFTAGANAVFLGIGSNAASKTLDNIEFKGGAISTNKVVQTFPGIDAFTNVPEVVFAGTRLTANIVVSAYANINCSFLGATLNNVNLGALRVNGSYTCTIRSLGTKYLGTTVTGPTGSPVVNVQSDEVQGDVTQAYFARNTGNHMWNTDASAGTLGQAGPVDCLGTGPGSWKLRGSQSLTY